MKILTAIISLIVFATHVFVVTRDIVTDSDPVRVHCFSGDDDFGIHVLNGAQRIVRRQGFVAFDEEINFGERLNVWLVREDGIYLSHDWNVMVKKYGWA
ncbi:hypothetical protein M569_15823 [Genlisea aurea]|uniref:S-protein homolog n=1 Tax=Genlisea aurea TaxID=192259 RepID=S8BXA8_9LAMI|nr:hypothetical protein M569_15823 [Genlisea aurea]